MRSVRRKTASVFPPKSVLYSAPLSFALCEDTEAGLQLRIWTAAGQKRSDDER